MSVIIRNKDFIPHQAVVFTNKDNYSDFSLQKVVFAYNKRKECIGENSAIWEIEFHPTNLCNMHCLGCSYGTRHNTQSLSLNQALSILEKYSSFDLKSVFFSGGGDPLLWEYWEDFFSSSIPRCKYGIATNMFNFEKIISCWHKFDFYQIHITGYDEDSCKQATGINAFFRINENISYLLTHRKPTQDIALKILVNQDNYKNISKFLDYVMDKGANSVILKFQQDFLSNQNFASDEILSYIREAACKHAISSQYDYLIDNLDDIIYRTYGCPEKCLFANSGLYRLVNATGDVYPCIAANANEMNKINDEMGFVDIYSKTMSNGKCPLKACRHYRFSQYLSKVDEYDSKTISSPPILL